MRQHGASELSKADTERRAGAGVSDQGEVRFLNRVFRWSKVGLQYEADPRHVELLAQQLGLKNSRSASTLGTRDEDRIVGDCNQPFDT